MSQGRPRHHPDVSLNKKKLEAVNTQHARLSLVDAIFELIVGQIQAGNLVRGQRIHSVRQLSEDCEVSRDTVARAYDKLVAHGHLDSRPGSGFYVKLSGRPVRAQVEQGAGLPLLPDWKRFRIIQPTGDFASTTGLGLLPAEWLDEAALGSALRTVARASQRSLSAYGDPLGYLPLRQQLQAKLKSIHIQAPVQQIMVTNGATDALNLIVMAQLRTERKYVLIEEPGPSLVLDRLMASGFEMIGVPRLWDGPDLDVLREQCERHKPRYFFCSSVLHNPTSSLMAPHKAYQLLRLAEEYNFTIVEDDTYCDLMPTNTDVPVSRLASLDQLQRVIYVGSFSKTIAPGLRLGYVCANPKIMEWLLVYRSVTQISSCSFGERAVYQLLSQGSYRHHCAQLRSRLDACRQPVVDQLQAIGCTIDDVPDAGMYVWATLPETALAHKIAETMYHQGHLMAPGDLFASDRQQKMRFNISRTLDSPALPVLAKLLKA